MICTSLPTATVVPELGLSETTDPFGAVALYCWRATTGVRVRSRRRFSTTASGSPEERSGTLGCPTEYDRSTSENLLTRVPGAGSTAITWSTGSSLS